MPYNNNTATTTSQIQVPGLETSIQGIVGPISNSINNQIAQISSLITLGLSGGGAKFANPTMSTKDTELSPFPTFAIWTNDNNNKAGFHIINSEYQTIGSINMPNYFGGWQSPDLDNMPNWYEDFRGYTYTQGHIGSSTVTTYHGGSTVWGSADGHVLYRPNLHGNHAGNYMNRADQTNQFLIRCGTIIGVKGVRQRVSHYSNDSEFQIRARGATTGYFDRVDLNDAAYATWAGRTNRGMSSYNDRTKMLAVVESTTSNSIRLHVWRNTSLTLNGFAHKAGTLHKFLSEAKTAGPSQGGLFVAPKSYQFFDFTWSHAGSTRNEPSYHMKLIMGDNGVVGFARFNHDGYAQKYGYFTIQSTGSAGQAGVGAFTDSNVDLGNTTSYGIDQSEQWYGQKHQITWDNEWVAVYSPYYYYACGINCHTINTYDPTKLFYFRNTNSASGHQVMPFKEGQFIINHTEPNGDSTGPYLYIADPSSAAKTFRRQNNTTLSYGGDLQPYNTTIHYQYDTHGSTTQYAHGVSMPHWSNP